MRWVAIVGLLLSVVGPTSAKGEPCRVVLRDVSMQAGLSFVHDRGAQGRKRLPETMGAGIAWLDYDGDGWLDLYVVQSGPLPDETPANDPRRADIVFRNRGPGADGTPRFERVAAGATGRGYGQGVVAGDVDGDGDPDLYVANYGPDTLLINQGDGTFDDQTHDAGLGLDGWSSSVALADYDGDGRLDLYVTRYLDYALDHDLFCGTVETGERAYCGPELFAGETDRLYRNTGRPGAGPRFVDATAETLGPEVEADGKGLGVLFTDLDGDRQPDLYVANDQTVNLLFFNRGPTGSPRFEDVSFFSGAGVNEQGLPEAGMGVAAGDVNGDGKPDLAVTNFDVETNTLYLNQGVGQFLDASVASGFGLPSFNRLGFGLLLVDLDGDGALDVYVANGHVRERVRRESVSYAEPDLVLVGDGQGRFSELACARGNAPPRVGRGLAHADIDHDGDPDLALSNSGGPLELLVNESLSGPWLGVDLRGDRPAVGATVMVREGGQTWTKTVLAGDSYQSSSDPRLSFALPLPENNALTVDVTWPDGTLRRLRNPPRNAYLVIKRP